MELYDYWVEVRLPAAEVRRIPLPDCITCRIFKHRRIAGLLETVIHVPATGRRKMQRLTPLCDGMMALPVSVKGQTSGPNNLCRSNFFFNF
jgi:hypothetical protein